MPKFSSLGWNENLKKNVVIYCTTIHSRARICKHKRSPGIDSKEYRFQGIDSTSLCSLAGRYVKESCRFDPPGWESSTGLLKRFTNSGSVPVNLCETAKRSKNVFFKVVNYIHSIYCIYINLLDGFRRGSSLAKNNQSSCHFFKIHIRFLKMDLEHSNNTPPMPTRYRVNFVLAFWQTYCLTQRLHKYKDTKAFFIVPLKQDTRCVLSVPFLQTYIRIWWTLCRFQNF